MTMQEIIKNTIVNNDQYGYFGIRIDCDVDYKVGDFAADSRVWDDGNATDDTLDGTSCIGVNINNIDKSVKLVNSYYGNRVYIVAGNVMEYGEDAGEYIIQNAKVIAIIK